MARTASKVRSKAAKKTRGGAKSPEAQDVESRVIQLAEQIGRLAGTVQYQAENWMDNETLKQQMTLIRDGASTILDQVSRAGSAATESAARLGSAASESAGRLADAAIAMMPGTAGKTAEAMKSAAAEAMRSQSRKPVAAPGKKHRKPPPQVKIGRHASEAAAQRFVDKPMPNRQRRG